MGVFTKKPRDVASGSAPDSTVPMGEHKTAHATDDAVANDSEAESSSPEDAVPTEGAQSGVQEVEGITLTWTKKSLIAVFAKYVHATSSRGISCLCLFSLLRR
jgi:hypothetical protein